MPNSAVGDDGSDRADQSRGGGRPHTRSTAARESEQAAGTDEQHEDHGREEERRQVLALARRQRAAQQAGGEADREAAECGRDEPVHPAEHHAREDDDRVESAKSGVTSGVCTVSITATIAASTPESRTANRSRGRPGRRASAPSEVDRRRPHVQADLGAVDQQPSGAGPAATTIATIVILRMSTPKTSTGWFSLASEAAGLPNDPNQSSAMLWSRKAIAKVATSITAGDCVRSGRKTSRSIASDSTSTTAKQSSDARPDRPVPLRRDREREGARHDQLAVGEVDEPQDTEDEADADGHQRVDRAEPDRVGEHLPVDVENLDDHER